MDELIRKIAQYASESEAVWGKAYGLFAPVIERAKCWSGVELGVAYAGHAEALLENTSIQKLYGVDPYLHFPGYDDPMNIPQNEFDVLFQFVTQRMSQYGNRYTHMRMTSAEASTQIGHKIDFIYIDADHSYQGVQNDLQKWFHKIRIGGIVGGHDYGHVNFPGVKQAIDEFFSRFNWAIHEEGEGVWWVEKKMINISFFIPAYNCEKTIEESAESIFNGNFQPGDELIIVNDASTDQTSSILEKLKDNHPEIILVTHRYNRGGGAARNTAILNTNHSLLFCLDSDNVLVPDSIPRLKEFLISSGTDAACFEEIHFFQDNILNVSHKWIFNHSKFDLADHLAGHIVPGASGNYMFTLNIWKRAGGYPEFAGALDAWGFGLRQHATNAVIYVLPSSYYLHRIGVESYWVRESRKENFSIKALQLLLPYINQFDLKDVEFLLKGLQKGAWIFDLSKHPIHLKNGHPGHIGITTEKTIVQSKKIQSASRNIFSRLRKALKRLLRR